MKKFIDHFAIGDSIMKKPLKALVGASAIFGVMAISFPAFAGSYNGVCEATNGGEVCLYQYDATSGPIYDTLYSKPSYTGSTFYGTSTLIDNNAASAWNRDPDTQVKFFFGANYTGAMLYAGGGQKVGFVKEISSHCFASNVACP
ncbi:peptidase inhibitor family I36 protein [Streptomyces werraensis]|uniref:peptidase inhibitor family I36 protein n=1 Tax=Streptomyces werraensis TaxID=68284 RepID=UPI00341A2864